MAYFLEVGLILLIVPWLGFWERNYFAASLPLLQAVIENDYIRGAVSGIGLLNILVGFVELRAYFEWKRRDQ